MMQKQDRHITAASFLALMLYFVPNLVQDIHRVFGHSGEHNPSHAYSGTNIHNFYERCPICVFEFSMAEDIDIGIIKLKTYSTRPDRSTKAEHQIFDLYRNNIRSRAPPFVA